jgi:hypothetical protein
MPLRAVIYGSDRLINIVFPNINKEWFYHNHRAYFIDPKAVCQVTNEKSTVRNMVELLYEEGNPIPRRSQLTVDVLTTNHIDSVIAEAGSKPVKGFWDIIRGR